MPLTVITASCVFLSCRFRVGAGRVALMVYELVFQVAPEALHGASSLQLPRRDLNG